VPSIYYGDEIGMSGGKDPGCRGAFIWNENEWNSDLRSYIKKLIQLRKQRSALRKGSYFKIGINSNPDFYAFIRKYLDDQILIVMNASDKDQVTSINVEELGWSDGHIVSDLLDPADRYLISDHTLDISLPAFGGAWIC
jgi:glycosidase